MAVIGYQAKVEADTGASSAYELIGAEQSMITVPAVEVTSVESTYVNQSNAAKTFVPGLYDHGTIEVETQYSAAAYTKVHGLAVGRTSQTWKITAPTGVSQTFSFTGFVTKLEGPSFEVEGLAKLKYSVKVSGAATLA